QAEPGRIGADATARLKQLLISAFDNQERPQTILGKLMSEPTYPAQLPKPRDDASWDELEEELQAFQAWRRSEFARFAYSKSGDNCRFFALGMSWVLPASDSAGVAYLANHSQYQSEQLQALAGSESLRNLLVQLWQRHLLYSPEAEFAD